MGPACLGDPTETFQAVVLSGLGEKKQKQLDWHVGPSVVEDNRGFAGSATEFMPVLAALCLTSF